jgi:hypothetical protein
LCNSPAATSDPKRSGNEEEEMPQIPQQAEGQPTSSDTDFLDEKMFTGDMAINRRNIRYLMDLSVADMDPASVSLPNIRLV